MKPTIGILIGGSSRRMGRAKALLTVEGTTLIERTVSAARTVGEKIVLLGRPPFQLPPALASLPILEDLHPGIGPMAGLEALLCARPDRPCMLLACDMPHLSGALLQRLCDLPADCDAAVVRTRVEGAHWHPCCAVYGPSVRPVVLAAVAAGQYGMIKLLGRLRVRPVELRGDDVRWVENWNEPTDVSPPDLRP